MNLRTVCLAAGLMILGTAALAGAQPPVTARNLEQRLASAKTPDDQEAIAAYYDNQATENDKLAVYHAGMANMFTKGVHPSNCRELIKQYRSAAETNRALAREHRAMAMSAK